MASTCVMIQPVFHSTYSMKYHHTHLTTCHIQTLGDTFSSKEDFTNMLHLLDLQHSTTYSAMIIVWSLFADIAVNSISRRRMLVVKRIVHKTIHT